MDSKSDSRSPLTRSVALQWAGEPRVTPPTADFYGILPRSLSRSNSIQLIRAPGTRR